MASSFPTIIDAFANPVYTKIDGTDVVSASHVNDLQSAVIAAQETLAGAGRPLNMASNNFIADNTSFKLMVESLDQGLGIVTQSLIDHKAATAGIEHHAVVVEVTPSQFLTSSNVQSAFLEHQSDIDNIMTGGFVNTVTLDDRYVVKAGSQLMEGPLTITKDIIVNGDSTLGSDPADTITIKGSTVLESDAEIAGTVSFSSNILMQPGQKIAENGAEDSSYILLGSDKLEFYSHKDISFRLDADDGIDNASENGVFEIRNGLDNQVFAIDENGDLSLLGDISANNLAVSLQLEIGSMEITDSKFDLGSESLHIQLDKSGIETSERFFITKNNDTGANLASPDMMLNVNENSELTTGVHLLKSGVQETGFFGLKVMSNNAGGVYYGAGVNFKHQLTNGPSSVTLIPSIGINTANLAVTETNEYGFFFEFDTPAVGMAKVSGTYITVGN